MAARPRQDNKLPNLSMNILPNNPLYRLPAAWHPYIEITRMHIPPTNLVVFYPFIVGTLFGATVTSTPLTHLLSTLARLYPLSLLSGATGHVLDDYLDHDIDRRYPRCQSRPIVRGAISPSAALAWANALSILYVLATGALLGRGYVPDAVVFVGMCWVYPLSKRYWHYPQLLVGPLHAFPVLYVARLLGAGGGREVWAMFVGFAAFAMMFDTGYALLDVEEDVKYGVGSMAVRFHGNVKMLLGILGVVHVGALAAVGLWAGFGRIYMGSVLLSALETITLIFKLNPSRPKSIVLFFVLIVLVVGGQMVISLALEWTIHRSNGIV